MPAFVTHSLMYEKLYQKFRPKNSAAFYWGLQGPDLLFYCKICKDMQSQIRIFKLGCSLHTVDVSKFYHQVSRYIFRLKGKEKEVIISYVEGVIAHNSLDYFAHPYIFYKEQEYMKNFGYKESALAHNKIESDLDSILWQGFKGKSIKKFKIKNKNVLSKKDKIYIAKLYVYLVKRLLHDTVTIEEILSCFLEANFLIKMLTKQSGVVNLISNVMERKLGVKARGTISVFVRTENPDLRILNLEKRDWYNLNDKSKVKNETFLQIYDRANMATIYEIKRFLACLKNKVFYLPKQIGSFENGKLDI